MNYFQSFLRLKVARRCLYDASAGAVSSLPLSRPLRLPNHNRTGKRTMRMISEKAVAFLLAVVVSGTAFNTFIV
jgi:hypothetical protein